MTARKPFDIRQSHPSPRSGPAYVLPAEACLRNHFQNHFAEKKKNDQQPKVLSLKSVYKDENV